MIETGTVLQQRYKIDRQIGQGGMGAVYIATDNRFASTVAIKETLCMEDNFRKAIEREARLLNSLKHSALPKVSDHFEENNVMFLVMEYIPGDDLAAMLEDTSVAFPVAQVMTWANQLLDALDYLHTQSMPVIHRDIKPQNLKVNARGEIILLDFGLAKGNPTEAGNQTAAKSIFGYSRNYASLEQIQGTGTDPRSDLYSLAATLYHLLIRRPPEDALTRAMSVLSAKPDPLAPASSVNPEVPRGVAGVLMKAMDLNANERPASAAEMRQMLNNSDAYAYLAEGATMSNQIDPRMFAQKTQLMPAGTRGVHSDPNAKTEVLPAYISQQTSVRPNDTAGQNTVTALHDAPPKRRGMAAGVGAAIALLVVCALAGGIYMVQPGVKSSETNAAETQPASSQPATAQQPAANDSYTYDISPAQTETDAAQAKTDTPAAVKSTTETARSAETGKADETAKVTAPTQQKAAGKNRVKIGDDDGTIEYDADEDGNPVGNFVLTERDEKGRVTKMHVDAPDIPKSPKNRGNRSEGFVFREGDGTQYMKPEDREKLRVMLRNLPNYKNVRPPVTPKKPDNQ